MRVSRFSSEKTIAASIQWHQQDEGQTRRFRGIMVAAWRPTSLNPRPALPPCPPLSPKNVPVLGTNAVATSAATAPRHSTMVMLVVGVLIACLICCVVA